MQKILLVEDDQFMKNIYLEMLSSIYDVDAVEDGESAYKKITKDPYDLILLDMFLPKMDGKMVFEQLEKNFPNQYKKKIVFMTNDDSEQTASYFNSSGIKYLIKSTLDPEQFLEKINNYLK
jgi:CheY-like chemotaxis protein